jgi:hypothetical protein
MYKTEKTLAMQIVSQVYKLIIFASLISLFSCGTNKSAVDKTSEFDEIRVNQNSNGQTLDIKLEKGIGHNYPTFAIWVEDMDGNFLQTLFVTKSIATGIYGHGPLDAEKWDTKPGWQKRPAALPYWINKRKPSINGLQLPDPDHPVPDAYTGATPVGNVNMESKLDKPMKGKIRILMEVNQPWDWNEYWTNDLYNDIDYKTSCQPSLVYAVTIDLDQQEKSYYMNPIGHGHFSGKNGELYTDLSSITTAREIFRSVVVKL